MPSVARALLLGGTTGVLLFSGCGLDIQGAPAPAEAGPSASAAPGVDGASADPDRAATSSEGGATCACALDAPAGFTIVAFAPDRSAPCAGDLQTVDRVTDPSAGPGACACAPCTIDTRPSCNTGSFDTVGDLSSTPSCNLNGSLRSTNGGNCANASGTTGRHGRVIPPNPSGSGTCSAAGVPNQAAARSQPVRICAPSAAGASCACDSGLAPGYQACLRATGDVACPAKMTKHAIGTSSLVACGACACSLTGVSCSGSASYYSSSNCGTLIATIDDKGCKDGGDASFNSYRWTGVANASCSVGAPPAASANLAEPETICCP